MKATPTPRLRGNLLACLSLVASASAAPRGVRPEEAAAAPTRASPPRLRRGPRLRRLQDPCDDNPCGIGTGGFACKSSGGGGAEYSCTCLLGYAFDGATCSDINECDGGICGDGGVSCDNAPGGYFCDCREGYAFDGVTCEEMAFVLDGSMSMGQGGSYPN